MLSTLLWIDLTIMLLAWSICTHNKRAGLVDIAWSTCIAINILICVFFFEQAPLELRLFIGVLSTAWFLRLSWHLWRRYANETEEDRRYANMRRALGRFQHVGFLLFFIFQAGLAILFSYPMFKLLSLSHTDWPADISAYLWIAGLVMLCALLGESIADQQLYRFKQDPKHHGKTMDQGLWRYSRHPNYFFEWLHWFAYPILGLAIGAYGLWLYPILMFVFLYYITGIPFSEQQAVLNRGQNYIDYQKRTSIFIPWKPKQRS